MKKLHSLLAAFLLALPLTSCAVPESPPMSETLRISAYVYPLSEVGSTDLSSLKTDDDIPDDSLIALEALETGREYLLAHVGHYNGINNINLKLEYDGGTVEIISDEKDSQLSVDEKQAIWDYEGFAGRRFGYDLTINNSGWVSVLPLGFCTGPHLIDDISVDPLEGFIPDSDESIITINALDGTGRIIVAAKLRLRAIMRNLCTLEILSFDYNDAWKLMEAENK